MSGVTCLPVQKSFGCEVDVWIGGVDDDRGFATQLKCDWCKVLGGCGCDDAGYGSVAGVEDYGSANMDRNEYVVQSPIR